MQADLKDKRAHLGARRGVDILQSVNVQLDVYALAQVVGDGESLLHVRHGANLRTYQERSNQSSLSINDPSSLVSNSSCLFAKRE